MKLSLSFYITMLVLKLKGVKKTFSQDPINYKKVRKGDVQNPKGSFYKKHAANFKVADSLVTEVKQNDATDSLVIFIHGGAFISGPGQIHWDTLKTIAQETKHTLWMCDYPKAPEHKISTISKNIDAVYQAALEKYDSQSIMLIGDSVGGTLIAALVQRLIKNNINLPSKVILVSPVMDASLSNPAVDTLDLHDPMLSKSGVVSAKRMCSENDDLKDERISPIHGSFEKFPETILFLASNDITYPDQLETIHKLKAANIKHEIITGEYMPHIWPLLPVMKEAKTARAQFIERLTN